MNTFANNPEKQTPEAAAAIAFATLHGELAHTLSVEALLRVGGEVKAIARHHRIARQGEILVHFQLERDSVRQKMKMLWDGLVSSSILPMPTKNAIA